MKEIIFKDNTYLFTNVEYVLGVSFLKFQNTKIDLPKRKNI